VHVVFILVDQIYCNHKVHEGVELGDSCPPNLFFAPPKKFLWPHKNVPGARRKIGAWAHGKLLYYTCAQLSSK